jgi:hypothetical protein
MSTFLAFFVDQIQHMSCQVFKKILSNFETKKLIWQTILGGLDWTDFMSWDEIYERLLNMKKDKNSS